VFIRARAKARARASGGHVREQALCICAPLQDERDCVLIGVRQIGGAACHTGRKSGFFHPVTDKNTLDIRGELLFGPAKVYEE